MYTGSLPPPGHLFPAVTPRAFTTILCFTLRLSDFHAFTLSFFTHFFIVMREVKRVMLRVCPPLFPPYNHNHPKEGLIRRCVCFLLFHDFTLWQIEFKIFEKNVQDVPDATHLTRTQNQ